MTRPTLPNLQATRLAIHFTIRYKYILGGSGHIQKQEPANRRAFALAEHFRFIRTQTTGGAMDQRSGNIFKITGALLAVAVAVWLVWMNLRNESPLADTIEYVDVTSGMVFRISRASVPSILPGENPKTKQKTLVPIYKRDDGQYYVSDRVIDVVRGLGASNKYVDVASRHVTLSK